MADDVKTDDEIATEFDAIAGEDENRDESEVSAAPEGENDATESADGGSQRTQPRELDSLYAANRRLQQSLDELAEQNRVLMQRLMPPEDTSLPERPARDNFDDDDEYFDALSDWKLAKWQREQDERQTKAAEEARSREFGDSIRTAYSNMHDEGRRKYRDYESVAGSAPLYNPIAGVAVAKSERAADVSYYLGKHHDVAQRLDQMDPIDAAREVGRIEALLSKPARKPEVSSAPRSPARETVPSAPPANSGAYDPSLSPSENARRRLAYHAGKA